MTWGSLARKYGLQRGLRRSMGLVDSCPTSQDSLILCIPPKSRVFRDVPKGASKQQLAARNGRVVWPEDRLMWDYFRKNPEVKQFPYTLNSFDAPFPKRFALRQLELMNSGKTKEEAYADVTREMQPEKQMLFAQVHGNRSSPSKSTYSVLSVVQEEEERQLLEGMRRFRKNNAS